MISQDGGSEEKKKSPASALFFSLTDSADDLLVDLWMAGVQDARYINLIHLLALVGPNEEKILRENVKLLLRCRTISQPFSS